jgi:hypothetical protein
MMNVILRGLLFGGAAQAGVAHRRLDVLTYRSCQPCGGQGMNLRLDFRELG